MKLLQQHRKPTSHNKFISAVQKLFYLNRLFFSLLKSHRCVLLVKCIVSRIEHFFLCPSLNPSAPLVTLLWTSITSRLAYLFCFNRVLNIWTCIPNKRILIGEFYRASTNRATCSIDQLRYNLRGSLITMAYRLSRSYPKMCFIVTKVKFTTN